MTCIVTVHSPTAKEPSFGILYIILTSIVGTAFSIAIGVPIGVLTAVFLAEAAPKMCIRDREKAGFELEGIKRKSIFKNGCIQDSYLYAVIHV